MYLRWNMALKDCGSGTSGGGWHLQQYLQNYFDSKTNRWWHYGGVSASTTYSWSRNQIDQNGHLLYACVVILGSDI